MDSWPVLFFTICLVTLVSAWIYVPDWLRNGENPFIRQLSNGGRRVSIGSRNKTRDTKCIQQLRKAINEINNDCGPMQISERQCQLLRSECLRLVKPTQPDSILKESYRAARSALKLMQDCCSEKWLLKALEFGNCREHFLEILHDLHRLPIVAKLVDFKVESLDEMLPEFRSTNISAEVEEQIFVAWESDRNALRSRVDNEIRDDDPDHHLADQLKETPSLSAPTEISSHVTEFDFLKTQIKSSKTPNRILQNPNRILIYKGGGGILVFRVTLCNKGFVIKMRRSKYVAEEDISLQQEANVMKKCRHPYAVGLLGYWEVQRAGKPKVPLLLMESMEYDLKKHIERNRKSHLWGPSTRGFPALDAISLVLPVAKAMRHLHSIGVVHRDLKPQNVLIARVPGTQHLPEDISVKLADFGAAQNVGGSQVTGAPVGTTGYMDPQVRMRSGTVDLYKADVFSFGMLFGEVLTGLSPLEALHCMEGPSKFYDKLKDGERPLLPKDTPKYVKDIVDSCCAWSPAARPSFEDICWKLQNTEFLLLNRFN